MTNSSNNLILFDMDGVILDSSRAIVSSIEAALRDNEISVPCRRMIEAQIGPPLRIMLKSILGDVTQDLLDRCSVSFRSHNDTYGPALTKIFPEALSLIPQLAGTLRMRVATSKAELPARNVMRQLDMAHYFDGIHGTVYPASDTKADVMRRALVAHRAAYRGSEVLAMVGDRAQDVEAAHALGICSIAVTWGYANGDELQSSNPDFLVADGESLAALISRLQS